MIPVNASNTVNLNRIIRASPERVFAAWTTPEAIRQWFGPDTCRVEAVELDLRVGGAYRIAVVSEQHGAMAVRGEYREISAPSKLVYTWKWEDDSDWDGIESIVTVEFIEANGGTEVRLTHTGFPNAESRGNHEHGWTGCFVKLAARADAICLLNGPSHFSWNELLVDDVEKAKSFYTQLLGWEAAPMAGPMPYTLFKKDGMEVAGLMRKPMPNSPSQWLSYVSVESVEKTTQRVVELGGQVIAPPFQIPEIGWIAVVLDPEGVSFGLFQRV